MEVHSGVSSQTSGDLAVTEAIASWPEKNPSFILVFHSTAQSADQVSTAIKKRFPETPFAGCTTAGEHLNGKHYNNSLVITGI